MDPEKPAPRPKPAPIGAQTMPKAFMLGHPKTIEIHGTNFRHGGPFRPVRVKLEDKSDRPAYAWSPETVEAEWVNDTMIRVLSTPMRRGSADGSMYAAGDLTITVTNGDGSGDSAAVKVPGATYS